MTCVLRLDDNNIAVMDKLHLYARLTNRIMEIHLSDVESSFTLNNADNFRTILSQEGANVECFIEAESDKDDESEL